jgi:ferrous iron transport protein B
VKDVLSGEAPAPVVQSTLRVALAGNPNSGKSTLFNALTGLSQKVANYPGVTVERKIGRFKLDGATAELIDLPGTYSLTAQAPDEEIARDILFGWRPDTLPPDVVVVVVDATHLERNLYLATQVVELGYRTVVALNMADLAETHGIAVDETRLAERFGCPVVKTVANKGQGLDALKAAIGASRAGTVRLALADPWRSCVVDLGQELASRWNVPASLSEALALRFLSAARGADQALARFGPEAKARVQEARVDGWDGAEAAARYAWVRDLMAEAVSGSGPQGTTLADRIDRILTHKVWGLLIFTLIMAVVFQSIFTWAKPLMDGIQDLFADLQLGLKAHLPPGILTDLITDGVVVGVGSVVQFVPQIAILFLFLSILEDSGYLVRPAFALDRLMRRFGLSGRSLIPLLSSFACAIPGIMATRVISNRNDRLLTILIAPLMTCSARLPIYTLMIAAFVAPTPVLGGLLNMQGVAMLVLYLLGVGGALVVAAVFKRTILKSTVTPLILELPPYRMPAWAAALREVWRRSFMFVETAGTLILCLSIVLWFLAAFPRVTVADAPALAHQDMVANGEDVTNAAAVQTAVRRVEQRTQMEQSFMGHLGRAIEPVVRPLGFDWKIGVSLLASFAAREVVVSTLGILYTVNDVETNRQTLVERLRGATATFTPAVVWSLLVFYVFACQCMSTVSVVVKETGGWRWPAFMVSYMMVLAYTASMVTYQGLHRIGY